MESQPIEIKEIAKVVKDPSKQVEKQLQVIEADVGDIEVGRENYHNLVDILFVLDTTGSMGWCIKESKKTIKKIIKKFSDKQYNIKFALDIYRDHPPQEYSYVEKHFDLRNQEEIINVLDNDCDAGGGGDTPEAVMDGLYQGLKKTNWRIGSDGTTKSKRFLFHCCDAPPHGKQYGQKSSQKSWQEKGCPCGISRLDIQGLLVQNKVDYSLIKVGQHVNIMESLFKECFGTKFKRVMPLEINKNQSKKLKKRKTAQYSPQYQPKEKRISPHYSPQYQAEEKGISSHQSPPKRKLQKKLLSYRSHVQQGRYSSQSCSQDDDQNFEDQQQKELERKRSMASLVCSQVESGLSDYEKELEQMKAK